MRSTKLYYRFDGRIGDRILNRCPKTKEEVDKLKLEEREMWTQMAGLIDEEAHAFECNKEKATEKLNRVNQGLGEVGGKNA